MAASRRKPPHLVLLGALRARPRLLASTVLGISLWFVTPPGWRPATRGLVCWDTAVLLYLTLVLLMVREGTPEKIRNRARLEDDGALTSLAFSTLAGLACFVAVAFELSAVKGLPDADKACHALLAAGTIVAAWVFIQVMFALHYAHQYYQSPRPALAFPGTEAPSYWDFFYFSFIIGTSAQTADVGITSPGVRALALAHCVLSFFFNITLLGLSINVASNLF